MGRIEKEPTTQRFVLDFVLLLVLILPPDLSWPPVVQYRLVIEWTHLHALVVGVAVNPSSKKDLFSKRSLKRKPRGPTQTRLLIQVCWFYWESFQEIERIKTTPDKIDSKNASKLFEKRKMWFFLKAYEGPSSCQLQNSRVFISNFSSHPLSLSLSLSVDTSTKTTFN